MPKSPFTENMRLHNILESSDIGTWEWNIKTDEIIINKKWAEAIGYELDSLLPFNKDFWFSLFHPEDLALAQKYIGEHLSGKLENFDLVYRLKHKNGAWIWVKSKGKVLSKDKNNDPLWMFGTLHKISKTREKQLGFQYFFNNTEKNFQNFFTSIDSLIFVADKNGKIIHANNTVCNKLGYTLAELEDMHILDLHPKNLRRKAEKILNELIISKRDYCPLPLLTKDGNKIPVETRAWVGEWNGNECLFGISKDRTEEQEALQKFNKLFKNNPAPMAVTAEKDKRLVDVNDSFLKIFKFSRNDVIGKTVDELDIFEDKKIRYKLRELLLKNGSVKNIKVNFKTKYNTRITGLLSSEAIITKGEKYFLTVMADITHEKMVEKELKMKSDFQKVLMNISTNCINIPLSEVEETINNSLQEIGRFVNADRSYIFNYDFDSMTTSNTFEWSEDGIEPQIDNMQDIPITEVPVWVNNHKNGKKMLIEDVDLLPDHTFLKQVLQEQDIKSVITIPMISDNNCLGFVGFDWVKSKHVFSDFENALLKLFAQLILNIKNRAIIDINLKQEKEKAQAASKAKSEFLANMSHEIRTPLNGVIGFTELLKSTKLSETQLQYVQNAATSATALLGIINDILDFSKIEAGKLELETVKTDLWQLVEKSLDIVKFQAGKKDIELLLDIQPDLPKYAILDPVRVKQILLNLLSNGVKFTEKGEVELAVKCEKHENNEATLTFSVRDTGIGINKKQKHSLFTAFNQGDTSTTRKYGGTGLGLVISNLLAKKMGSKIDLESSIGHGTKFVFSIKTICEGESPYCEQKNNKNISDVLILTFNKANRKILNNIITFLGINTKCIENCKEAANLQSNHYDLAIIDYDSLLSCEDESNIIKSIHNENGSNATPILLLHNSFNNKQLYKKIQKLDINWAITKPLKPVDLIDKLQYIKTKNASHFQRSIKKDTVLNSKFLTPKILIAEDVYLNYVLTETLIRKYYPKSEIFKAENGKEAVIIAEKETPDIVLMDIQMPEMDGIEATRQIKQLPDLKDIHIIALTAGTIKGEKEKCLAVGMDDFMLKPINAKALKDSINFYYTGRDKRVKHITVEPPAKTAEKKLMHFNSKELLSIIGNDKNFYKSLLDESKVKIPEAINGLNEMIAGKASKEIENSAHKVKGMARSMYFEQLAKLAEIIECNSNDTSFAVKTFKKLTSEWNNVLELLTD